MSTDHEDDEKDYADYGTSTKPIVIVLLCGACIRHSYIGHHCIRHSYIGHNYIDQNYIGHNYMCKNYIGRNYVGRDHLGEDYISHCHGHSDILCIRLSTVAFINACA